MRQALAPHVRLAVLGDDVVLLDIRTDAYFCAPDAREALQPSDDRSAVAPVEVESAEALREAGFLVAGAPEPRDILGLPMRDVLDDPPPGRLTTGEALSLAGAVWDLSRHYRGRSFAEILEAATPGSARRDDPSEALRLARLFHHLAPWLPVPDKCLARSFVLLRFLQRSGVSARWMFGVRTWPFAAHCWLQVGDVALDDAAERLRVYEPIHAVG